MVRAPRSKNSSVAHHLIAQSPDRLLPIVPSLLPSGRTAGPAFGVKGLSSRSLVRDRWTRLRRGPFFGPLSRRRRFPCLILQPGSGQGVSRPSPQAWEKRIHASRRPECAHTPAHMWCARFHRVACS